jgi:hypothetical protein
MGHDYTAYFEELHKRVDSAVKVRFRAVELNGKEPRLNGCHDNVNSWVENHPGTKIVRGWLFWPPNEAGQYTFMAHSVVEENGQLIDITPFDRNTPRGGLVFLKHEGTEEDFEPMKTVCSKVLYPPMTMEELQTSHFVDLEEETGV